ncbi:hypothetical protein L2E82_39105 [Cichorium intybus]|uniref:Uncharacterized protein n=1 Tax=Cichorium intybus TaxID=13427 RepID=A0ACB9ALP3_CICIN|nr:hypothetical protein L2E82_39105 [Cichorium intybus]
MSKASLVTYGDSATKSGDLYGKIGKRRGSHVAYDYETWRSETKSLDSGDLKAYDYDYSRRDKEKIKQSVNLISVGPANKSAKKHESGFQTPPYYLHPQGPESVVYDQAAEDLKDCSVM